MENTNTHDYKGYIITPNLTGYVEYEFYEKDAETISGNGESVEDCKNQIDDILSEQSEHKSTCKEDLQVVSVDDFSNYQKDENDIFSQSSYDYGFMEGYVNAKNKFQSKALPQSKTPVGEKTDAIEHAYGVLLRHNQWRRGGDNIPESPAVLGNAIDTMLNYYRQSTLQWFDNNGWIKIESDEDREPIEDVWAINVNGNKQVFYHDALKYISKSFTHYQPIVKPLPPIY